MKCLNKILLLIIILFSPLIAQQSLTLSLSLQKDTFIVGESIDIGLTIKNNSNTVFYPDPNGFIKIDVLKDNGTKLNYVGIVGLERKWISKVELLPGEDDYILINLNSNYADKHFNGVTDNYLSEGKYNLIISLDKSTFISEMKSISFSVIEPKGDELNVFTRFEQLASTRYYPTRASEFVGSLEELHKNYPKSVYSPMILDVISAVYIYGSNLGRKKGFAYWKELAENYPWSGLAINMIEGILPTLSSKSERIEFLQKILSKSGKSLTHKLIEKKLLIESQ